MLIKALARVFGAEPFDATDVYGAVGDQELLAAIEAEIPRARRKRNGKPAELNTRAIRMGLRRLKGIKAHYYQRANYWTFRVRLPLDCGDKPHCEGREVEQALDQL